MEQAIKNNDLTLVTKFLKEGQRYPLMLHDAVFTNNIEMDTDLYNLEY